MNTIPLLWTDKPARHYLAPQLIAFDAGDAPTLEFTAVDTSMTQAGRLLALYIFSSLEPDGALVTVTNADFSARTDPLKFSVKIDADLTAGLGASDDYTWEAWDLTTGSEKVLSYGPCSVSAGGATLTATPVSGVTTLGAGGTGSNLSATGPGVLQQTTNGANVSILSYSAAPTYFLSRDGTWRVPAGGGGSGTPGGSDKQIQFNDAGSFAGSPYMAFDKATGAFVFSTDPAYSTDLGPLNIATVPGLFGYFNSGWAHHFKAGTNASGFLFHQETTKAGGAQEFPVTVSFYATHNDPTATGGAIYPDFGSITNLAGNLDIMWGTQRQMTSSVGTTVQHVYGFQAQPHLFGTVVAYYGFHSDDVDGQTGVANKYHVWAQSRGVYRVKADNPHDSVFQAIPALYNPLFTQYTPGAADYERIVQAWNGNVAEIGAEKGGTGALRPVRLLGTQIEIGSGILRMPEISAPATPASGLVLVYAKNDHKVYRKDSTGTETELGGGSGGGTPGGSDTQVQFNDGGAFGGDAGLAYNKTTDTLTVAGTVAIGGSSNSGLQDGSDVGVGNLRVITLSGGVIADWRWIAAKGFFDAPSGLRWTGNGNSYWAATNSANTAFAPAAFSKLFLFGAGTSLDAGLDRPAAGVISLTDGSTGGGILEFPQVSSGGTPSTNSARLYAKDAGGTAEVFVKDEAGNETQISPHAMDGPASFYDATEALPPHVVKESNQYLGIVRYTNQSRFAKLLEALLKAIKTGSVTTFAQFAAAVQAKTAAQLDLFYEETFATHNARLTLAGNRALTQVTWSGEQAKLQAAYDAARAAEQAAHDTWAAAVAAYPGRLAAWQAAVAAQNAWAANPAGPQPPAPGDAPQQPGSEPTVRPARDIRKPVPAWLAAKGVS